MVVSCGFRLDFSAVNPLLFRWKACKMLVSGHFFALNAGIMWFPRQFSAVGNCSNHNAAVLQPLLRFLAARNALVTWHDSMTRAPVDGHVLLM